MSTSHNSHLSFTFAYTIRLCACKNHHPQQSLHSSPPLLIKRTRKKMVNFHLIILVLCSVAFLVSGFSRNLPTVSFDEGYTHLFGDSNLRVLEDGKSVHLSLDQRTGFYKYFFFSKKIYLFPLLLIFSV